MQEGGAVMTMLHTRERVIFSALCMSLMLLYACPVAFAQTSDDELPSLPVNFGIALMLPGQSRSFTAESDLFFNFMVIPVFAQGSGTLSISLSKTDTYFDFISVMQSGYGYPDENYNMGFTPRTVSISTRFWDYGTTMVYAMLFSLGEGPYSFRVSLSYN